MPTESKLIDAQRFALHLDDADRSKLSTLRLTLEKRDSKRYSYADVFRIALRSLYSSLAA